MPTPGAFTNYLEDAIINYFLRNQVVTQPTTVYVALLTADPTDTGAMTNEVSNVGTGYTRMSVTFNAPATPGQTSNNGAVTFPTALANWGLVSHFLITDSGTYQGGNALFRGALDISKQVYTGDTVKFNDQNITITID